MNEPLLADLVVVGTTTPVRPEDLPACVEPIYRSRDGEYYLAVEGDSSESTWFEAVDSSWITTQQDEGDVLLFEEPLAARPGHVLLIARAAQAPEYVPESELSARLVELGQEALRLACRAVEAGDHGAAEADVWYAARAMPREPLPLLALRALLEGKMSEPQLAYIDKDIADFTKEQRARALEPKDSDIQPLIELIRADRGAVA